jgi:lipopolysaccharide/colanic/teichoic acid biosynthesis glycosyltransferase
MSAMLAELSETVRRPPRFLYRENHGYRRFARCIDVVVASLALVVAAPVLAVAALAIKMDDGGRIFFVQKRVGRFGRLFDVYKLRTMRTEACSDELSPTQAHDTRITRVGRYLRKLSIDELPQLSNVLRGEMALVGPRPEMPFVVRQYAPWQQLRHMVTPGITGLWQVECRSVLPLHRPEATALDLKYISSASPLTDGAILVKTVRAIFSSHGAY